MKKIVIIILFISLFLFTTPLIQATELPTETNTKRYIENLVNSYNSLIKFNYIKENVHFEEFKKDFYLYHADGYSFNIVVVRGYIYDNSTLFFIFSSSISPHLTFDFDYQHNITEYNPNLVFFGVFLPCNRCRYYDNFFSSPEQISYADFTLTVLSEKIINSTMIDSTSYARQLYNEHNGTFQSQINQKYPPINHSTNITEPINITENISKENPWNGWQFGVGLFILQIFIIIGFFIGYEKINKLKFYPLYILPLSGIYTWLYSGYLDQILMILKEYNYIKMFLGIFPFIPIITLPLWYKKLEEKLINFNENRKNNKKQKKSKKK